MARHDGRAERARPAMRDMGGGGAPRPAPGGKGGGRGDLAFEGGVKCSKGGVVRSVATREPRPISVPVIVSWLESSERTTIGFSPTEAVAGGDSLAPAERRPAKP